MKTCSCAGCSVVIQETAAFCRKHMRQNQGRKTSPARKFQKMFSSDGKVNVGMGLSRLKSQDKDRRIRLDQKFWEQFVPTVPTWMLPYLEVS